MHNDVLHRGLTSTHIHEGNRWFKAPFSIIYHICANKINSSFRRCRFLFSNSAKQMSSSGSAVAQTDTSCAGRPLNFLTALVIIIICVADNLLLIIVLCHASYQPPEKFPLEMCKACLICVRYSTIKPFKMPQFLSLHLMTK